MAADSSSNNRSPRTQSIAAGGDLGGGSNSPQSRRRNLPSPWAQVVRGEPESSSSSPSVPPPTFHSPSSSPPPPQPQTAASATAAVSPEQGSHSASSPDSSGNNAQPESSVDEGGNVAPPRRPAWNRPVNGVVEPVSVMGGAVSWPALSESTRPGMRSTTDSSGLLSNGTSSVSQEPIVNQLPQRQANAHANGNSNHNSNANHSMPGRQRSTRHRGGGGSNHNAGGSGRGGYSRPSPPPPPPLPPPFPLIEIPYGNMVPPVVMDSSVRGPRPMGGVGPQPHTPNDHSTTPRNSSRRGNYGSRPRGDGSYHNNHGSRRDQERRDVHMQQFVPPATAFIPQPPPGTPPPYGSLAMRPFPGPMGFDMASPFIYVPTLSPESFRGVPLIPQAPPPPMFYPMMESDSHMRIVNQIDYYFSDENLVKDDFLRSNMDEEGWVPISLISNFPRVARWSSSTEFILECLKSSTAVEIQGDKLRRRGGWSRWIHTPARFNNDSDSHSTAESTCNVLANFVQNVSLDSPTVSGNSTTNAVAVDAQTDTDPSTRSSAELVGASQLANGDGNAEGLSSSPS